MALHLLLSRMNPSACLFGNTDNVLTDNDDDEKLILKETSQQSVWSIDIDSPIKSLGGSPRFSSFGCLSSNSYGPEDTTQPLSNDAILLSLEKVVPECLAIIASPPSTSSSGAFSQKEMRKVNKQFHLKKTAALKKLHDLTVHEYNRIPLVQTEKWDIVAALSMALVESCDQITADGTDNNQSMDENRRLICWTINNLSIPYENKATMISGDRSSVILQALMKVIDSNLPEAYLCCIFINNLTFLADAIKPVTLFVPLSCDNGTTDNSPLSKSRSSIQRHQGMPPTRPGSVRSRSFATNGRSRSAASYRPQLQTKRSRSLSSSNGMMVQNEGEGWDSELIDNVLSNPASLLRTIERMMITNAPFLLSDVKSVQGEAIRWACGFIRNVTNGEEKKKATDSNDVPSPKGRKGDIDDSSIQGICVLVARTEIPRLVVQFVRDSPNPTLKWTKDSLEDICLGIMCNIARFSSRESLLRAGAAQCLEKLETLPGIHGYRARAVLVSLGALPKQF